MSPFDGLQMPHDLACEFFAVFSRFEFALKDCNYYYVNRFGRAVPNWDYYYTHANALLMEDYDIALADAVHYLNSEPPGVQTAPAVWDKNLPLRGPSPIGTALDATIRVRNNLFHGGKHTPHSPLGRDEKLVRAALYVLNACLAKDDVLRSAYEQPATF